MATARFTGLMFGNQAGSNEGKGEVTVRQTDLRSAHCVSRAVGRGKRLKRAFQAGSDLCSQGRRQSGVQPMGHPRKANTIELGGKPTSARAPASLSICGAPALGNRSGGFNTDWPSQTGGYLSLP